jgi:hypothetical protein
MRWWKKVIIGATAIILVGSAGAYFWALHSDAYSAACKYVSRNTIIENRIGRIEKCQLKVLGWRIAYSGPNGVANFGLNVAGEKADGEVYLNMRTELGEWKVTGAKLRLQDGSFIKVQ